MVAPFSTVGGYGGNPSLILDPTTGLSASEVDTQDGFPTLHPANNPAGTGPVQLTTDPMLPQLNFYLGLPEINAVLVELRVISALLREQMGDTRSVHDLQTMRADEAWNTNIATGAL